MDELLADGVWNGEVIFKEIQALGYSGGPRVLRQYIHPKRVLRPSKATVRFETKPGEQLQHDWGELFTEIGGVTQKIYFAVNTLGYSRRFHVVAGLSCDAEHTYESLVRSFGWFGGVTGCVLVDNQKCAVLEHRPNSISFNPRFKQLALHYGFTPKACRPYRARTKGKVERMVRYVKENFFVRYRAFESTTHLNQQLEGWLLEIADRRVHTTVKEVVATRFQRERPALAPLPRHAFDTSYIEQRQVGWDAYVDVRGNRYSVPGAYCGQSVSVHIGLDDSVVIYHGETRIAQHRLCSADAGWQTVADHHERLWADVAVQARSLTTYEEVAHATG